MKKAICISLVCIMAMQLNVTRGEVIKKATQEELNAIYQQVFGIKQAVLPTTMRVDIEVNGKPDGKISVQTDTKKITKLQRNVLLPKLKRYLKTGLYTKLEKSTSKHQWLSTRDLKGVGVTANYNIMQLAADIHINKRSMNRRMRAMFDALPGTYKVIPENLLQPAEISAFVNLRSNMSYQHNVEDNKAKFNLRAESAINILGYVLENQHTFQVGVKSRPRRDYTRLVIDDPENDYRYKIGDINTKTRNFQSHFQLGGIQLSKESIWSGAHEVRPQGNFSFTLDSDAEVGIYQDGRLTRTVNLKAGSHTLNEIRATQGNQIRLRIKDEFGKIRLETFNRFSDSRLLKPGYARYAVSIGAQAERQDSKIHYDVGRKIASAYYQLGITEHFTVGLDAQTDSKSHQIGTDAIWATAIGNMSAGLAYTLPEFGKTGHAVRLQLNSRHRPQHKKKNKVINWDISAQRTSKYYQGIGTIISSDVADYSQRTKQQLDLNLSRNFSDTASGSLSFSHIQNHDNNSSHSLGISLSKRIAKKASFSVSGSYSKSSTGDSDKSFRVSLNFPLGRKASGRYHSLNSSYSSSDQSSRATYRIGSKGRLGKDSLSGSVNLQSKAGAQALGANMRYRAEKFDINARHSSSINNSTGKVTQSSSANINTALVFADNVFALSRPVSDSFLILDGPRELQYPMAVSKGKNLFNRKSNDLNKLPKHYDAVLEANKAAVIPNLSSYRVQHISADSAVLPEGFDLNATEFDLMPDYKSGYHIKVGGGKKASFSAKILSRNGQPLTTEGGQLVSQNILSSDTKPILFFTDDSGAMNIESIDKGNYFLELFNYPNDRSKLIKIGTVDIINEIILMKSKDKK